MNYVKNYDEFLYFEKWKKDKIIHDQFLAELFWWHRLFSDCTVQKVEPWSFW
jgi:hypothetical protein